MKFLASLVLYIGITSSFAFGEEKIIGKLIDKKNGNEIRITCIDSQCKTIEFQSNDLGQFRPISRPIDIESEYVTLRSLKKELGTPWFAATAVFLGLLALDANENQPRAIGVGIAVSPLLIALGAIEGTIDVLAAPGFEISSALQRARVRKIELALNGDEVKVVHRRFEKILDLIKRQG